MMARNRLSCRLRWPHIRHTGDVSRGTKSEPGSRPMDLRSCEQSPRMGREFHYRCYTTLMNLQYSHWRWILLSMLFGHLHKIEIVRRSIWDCQMKSKNIEAPCTDVSTWAPEVIHSPESLRYFIWVSNASTSRVALSRIVLATGAYWILSKKKGMWVEPEASTVKLLGVVLITIFDNEQISALLEILFEIKAFPSIKTSPGTWR